MIKISNLVIVLLQVSRGRNDLSKHPRPLANILGAMKFPTFWLAAFPSLALFDSIIYFNKQPKQLQLDYVKQ